MAVAGKVAITLSTENGGAWSADVTYDRLVAVKHNNNLYISRKTVANVEPPNDEFWFLALEGFGGDDVQALIDRLNELSDLIQAIINGTTQVGNAKTLDGHKAEDFATAVDLLNYLSKSGGTLEAPTPHVFGVKNTAGTDCYVNFNGIDGLLGYLGFYGNNPAYIDGVTKAMKMLLHTGNKPTGTYTGNGSAEQRTIATGGIGSTCIIEQTNYTVVLGENGGYAVSKDGTITWLTASMAKFVNGVITIATDNGAINYSGATYKYKVV